jgi:hypothetical protein
MPPGLTTVRYSEEEGRELLRLFIFGGMLGPGRVPRGIEPRLVLEFIQQELKPDSEPDAYGKALEALRFYEGEDAVPHLMTALNGKEANAADLRRSAYAIQAAGDLSIRRLVDLASDYFDRFLVPHPVAPAIIPLLLETQLVLAPLGSMDALSQRLQDEVTQAARTQYQDEPSMMAYDKLAALQRNDEKRYRGLMAAKARIQGLTMAARRNELVAVYMGQSTAFHPLLETWAGRRLRLEALTVSARAVLAEFEQELDAVDPSALGDSRTDTRVIRAAQAILYLGGSLSAAHQRLYQQAKEGTANFLWDDP